MTHWAWRWLTVLALAGLAPGWVHAADDGRRAVDVKRFGISVRVPQAWRLVSWARDNEAFRLGIPQDIAASKAFVDCRLSLAPEDLSGLVKSEQPVQPVPERPLKVRLIESRVEPIDASRLGQKLKDQVGDRLVATWEMENDVGERWFETRSRVISFGTLYSFTMLTDEAHWEAYRLDFDDMLASVKFSKPETGAQRIAGGLWMQREFGFALRLPDGWQPAFGPTDRALLYATGPTREGVTDTLVIQATAPRPLDLENLKTARPAEIAKSDPRARAVSEIVPQGATFALETRIHTWQGQTPITILERRFRTARRNYIIRFTCETSRLEQLEPQFNKSLDSFVDTLGAPPRDDA